VAKLADPVGHAKAVFSQTLTVAITRLRRSFFTLAAGTLAKISQGLQPKSKTRRREPAGSLLVRMKPKRRARAARILPVNLAWTLLKRVESELSSLSCLVCFEGNGRCSRTLKAP
jgi:hypothetical protein